MQDTVVTVQGWVGTEVRYREAAGVPVATIRVASTPRIRKGEEWVDGETTWYAVTVWRTLAEHVCHSVHKGDAVIVHGRLRSETYVDREGARQTELKIEASLVGHDLSRGVSKWWRPEKVDQVLPRPLTPVGPGDQPGVAAPEPAPPASADWGALPERSPSDGTAA